MWIGKNPKLISSEHASCWSGEGKPFLSSGDLGLGWELGFQDWVHAKYCKMVAHLFSTTLATTGGEGAGALGAAGALLGAEVLLCGAKLANCALSKLALLSATDPEFPPPPAG